MNLQTRVILPVLCSFLLSCTSTEKEYHFLRALPETRKSIIQTFSQADLDELEAYSLSLPKELSLVKRLDLEFDKACELNEDYLQYRAIPKKRMQDLQRRVKESIKRNPPVPIRTEEYLPWG